MFMQYIHFAFRGTINICYWCNYSNILIDNIVKLIYNVYGIREINTRISLKCMSFKEKGIIKFHFFYENLNKIETELYHSGIVYICKLRNRGS